ncbi:hypothetical protein [Lacinutrix jangbogonensis]|uniref:hypothetical protein n=1 Tax=Lacinutrix jangbogonensis TaxID=1469557 RepID=UPI00053EE6AF|nr:hypothetical protein [Lacinutrix jangbogonensis]
MKLFFFTLVLLQLNFNTSALVPCFVSVQNSSSQHIQNTSNNLVSQDEVYEDDFAPMLLFLVIFALVCIGAGIVLTALVLLIIFVLIGAGILSASILVGLNNKSFSKGFKTFLVSTSAVVGLTVGLSFFYAIHETMKIWTLSTALISGGLSGIIAGIGFGFFAFYVIQKLTSFFKVKLNKALN